MEFLPLFIIEKILSYLSDQDKTNFVLINKQWLSFIIGNKWNGQFMRISDTILKSFPNLKPLGMTLNTIPKIIPNSVYNVIINENQTIKSLLSL
jgi:hypothetical protein